VIAKTARDMGILTVGVVTKPFHFEGQRRMRTAESGIAELHKVVDTLLIIPNQNLFRVANEKTTFADAFAMADQVLLTAAEAAIANPLIDDSSMKGARGLLISITGGRDLTLFEVDEAATRIREEVDQDANIIVGATFDETLDGIIRVSVVATGIEQALISRNAGGPAPTVPNAVASHSAPDSRLAELTARLRADNARLAERAQKIETSSTAQPTPAAPHRASNNVERAALAAIAAAVAPESPAPLQPASYGDVTVRPIAQKPTLFPDHHDVAPASAPEPATPDTFIPQAAERPPVRAPRMPKFDELPMPAQNEIRQARGEVDDEHPQKTRMSLLQRLANVGLGRHEETEPPIAARTSGPAMAPLPPLPERKPQRSVAQQIATQEPVSEYARRSTPQGLDIHGRPAPVAAAPQGDDHLDIPAFLRRQVN
jgi:cell division protein FtsZ